MPVVFAIATVNRAFWDSLDWVTCSLPSCVMASAKALAGMGFKATRYRTSLNFLFSPNQRVAMPVKPIVMHLAKLLAAGNFATTFNRTSAILVFDGSGPEQTHVVLLAESFAVMRVAASVY